MKTLSDWQKTIEREVPFIDKKPYSHNIISLALQAIAEKWGNETANKTIVDYRLEHYGWSQVHK